MARAEKPLRAPFPYPGAKGRVAPVVWQRFGEVARYVEPFGGSAAVLLNQPSTDAHELLGDAEAFVSNFWRSVQLHPEEVAKAANLPPIRAELTAIRLWLWEQRDDLVERLTTSTTYCDPVLAGRWAWVRCVIIGAGLAETKQGKSDIRPASTGMGLASKRIAKSADPLAAITEEIMRLHRRLRGVVVMHGDWKTVVTEASLFQGTGARPVGVFLDPPYDPKTQVVQRKTYLEQRDGLAGEVVAWCKANGDDPRLRIALCGYAGAYDMPASWSTHSWESTGYAYSKAQAEKRKDETVWFSPHCLDSDGQPPLAAMPLFAQL